jgi:hypothetical protein
MGVLLGLLTGAGAATWRAPMLLALNAPHYGLPDPLLGVDLGTLVARYPLWHAAHRFILILVLLGVFLTVTLYASIGAIKRQAGRLEWHPDARRHLGALSAVLAIVVVLGYLLAPYRLATSIDVPLTAAAASTRVLAAQAAAGAAVAAAALSLGWVIRGRATLVVSGWLVLALAAVTERLVVPAFVAESGSAVERAALQRSMDSVMYRLTLEEAPPSTDTLPPIAGFWDPTAIESWASQRGQMVRGLAPIGQGPAAEWLVATTEIADPDRLLVTRILPSRVDGLGRLMTADTGHPAVMAPRSVPGASGWAVTRSGVRVGRFLRPLALAWSQQAPGILNTSASAFVDWNRDPRDRVRTLVPALDWRPIGLAHVHGRLVWVLSGLATVERAPLSTRIAFGGRTVSGVVPSLIAVVVAETGAVDLYPDPSSGPLGVAWQRAFRGVLSPPEELPDSLTQDLGFPSDWFVAQTSILSQSHWGVGVLVPDMGNLPTGSPVNVWTSSGGALQQAMEDPEHHHTVVLLTGQRAGGRAEIRVNRLPAGVPTALQLKEAWQQIPAVEQLADSLRAAGDTLSSGPVRWHQGAAGVLAWQPMRNGSGQGPLSVLWVAAASPNRVAGGRRPQSAWASVLGTEGHEAIVDSINQMARVEAVRSWMRRGDSALVRGDLTAFARAWEALRGLLLDTTP